MFLDFLDSIEYWEMIGYFRSLLDQPHDVSIRSLFGGVFVTPFVTPVLGPQLNKYSSVSVLRFVIAKSKHRGDTGVHLYC